MQNIEDKTSGLARILDYKSTGKPVVSIYLMVDQSRTSRKDYQTELNSMIVASKEKLDGDETIDRNEKKEIYDIYEKARSFVNDKFRADSTKTLAIFSSGDGVWEEFRIPIIMKSRIIIDPKPYTKNIRALINNSKKYGVLMVDREKAQIYSIYLGVLNEYLGAFISDVPSKVNYRSQAVLREKKLSSRFEEKLHHFFKMLNEKILDLYKGKKFDYLILSGRQEILPGFKNYMHSYLQSVYIGSIDEEPDSKVSAIIEKAKKVIEEFEGKAKNELIDKLINEYNPNGLSVMGIDATIKSLLSEQIRILIYDSKFTHSGYVCEGCGYLTVEKKDRCPYCGGEISFYNDVVDEIVENALDQGCEIVDVEENANLISAGSIGAILRYKR